MQGTNAPSYAQRHHDARPSPATEDSSKATTSQCPEQLDATSLTADGADWSHSNGHASQHPRVASQAEDSQEDVGVNAADRESATLLANMQGFASALGCDWQVRLAVMLQ